MTPRDPAREQTLGGVYVFIAYLLWGFLPLYFVALAPTGPWEVVAVGPGRIDDNGNRVPLDVAVGDRVIYSKYGGTEVKFGGDEFLVLSARDVLAVVVR